MGSKLGLNSMVRVGRLEQLNRIVTEVCIYREVVIGSVGTVPSAILPETEFG